MASHDNETKGLWAFFLLTYTIMLFSWGVMAAFQIPGASAASRSASPTYISLLLFSLGGFSPSIAGVIVTWRVGGRKGLRDLWQRVVQTNLGWSTYAVILLLPAVVLGLRLGVQIAYGEAFLDSPLLTRPLSLFGFTVAMIFGGAISEEFGWRGFALDKLLSRWSLDATNLILAFFWAFWHLPLFFIPGTTQAGRGNVIVAFAIFALGIVGLTVLFTWLHIRTDRSLFTAILFHATINWSSSFAGTLIRGGLIDQATNAAAIALFALAVVIWWKPVRHPSVVNRLRSA